MPGWWNGRHRRLKISRLWRAGSSPAPGTKFNAPIVYPVRTTPFQGVKTGSNPVGCASYADIGWDNGVSVAF